MATIAEGLEARLELIEVAFGMLLVKLLESRAVTRELLIELLRDAERAVTSDSPPDSLGVQVARDWRRELLELVESTAARLPRGPLGLVPDADE